MEAENRCGVYERAVRGGVRLAGLAAESVEVDVVRDALVRELRVVLDLESVTVVTCDQDPAGDRAGDRERGLALELRPPTRTQQRRSCWPASRAVSQRMSSRPRLRCSTWRRSCSACLAPQHEAATDVLTGCLNRRAALARLGEEIARAHRAHPPVSCLMLDIDNLKQINDTLGILRAIGFCARPARGRREPAR